MKQDSLSSLQLFAEIGYIEVFRHTYKFNDDEVVLFVYTFLCLYMLSINFYLYNFEAREATSLYLIKVAN